MTNIEQNQPVYISREEKNGITQELLKAIFDYKDGNLYLKITISKRQKRGDIVGYVNNHGYKMINIFSENYNISRLIFLYHKGFLREVIDHIDKDKGNDKIENLRGCTFRENMRNRTCAKNSSSRYLGVSYNSKTNNYTAKIRVDEGKSIRKNFKDEDKAALFYNEMALLHFKEFASLNIIKPK